MSRQTVFETKGGTQVQATTNAQLLEKVAAGDREAFDMLIAKNIGLVRNVAQRFCGRGVEYEDLIQIGSIGMMKAARSFDPAFGTVFSTYAVPLIIGEIRRCLRDDGIIKVSRTLKQQGGRILHEREAFCKQYGREPHLSELAARCGMEQADMMEALDAVSPVRSMEDPVGEDGATLGSLLSDPTDEVERSTDHMALTQIIRTLPKEQQQLLYLRYTKEFSQQRTGEILGMTQVKVSREEKKAIATLRKALGNL